LGGQKTEQDIQFSGAGTKEITNSRFSRGERGDAEEQPNSQTAILSRRHGGTEKNNQVKETNSQLLAEEQPKPHLGFLPFLRALRASVRAWLLEFSFCHKKKLKISVQRNTEKH
jgi:hypothetical protein